MSGKCDFCSDPHPSWIYPARDFEVRKFGWGSDAAWAACEECSQLIEDEKHDTMVLERMLPTASVGVGAGLWDMLGRQERRYVEDQTRRLYNKFRRARTGARKLLA